MRATRHLTVNDDAAELFTSVLAMVVALTILVGCGGVAVFYAVTA